MTTSVNNSMRRLLAQAGLAPELSKGPVPEDLLDELADGFEEVQGCILPRDPTAHGSPLAAGGEEDETGIECQVSKVNFSEYVDTDEQFATMLQMAMGYAFALREALQTSGFEGPFRIIIGADAVGEYPSATVRYHRRREGQGWLTDELEGYKDGVMAIDF